MGELIEMPFGEGLTYMGPRNHVLDRGRDWTNPLARPVPTVRYLLVAAD